MDRGAKKSLGQNFLINSQKIESILLEARDHQPDMVVEVGPGLGALTRGLIRDHKKLCLIEMDKEFANYWRKQGVELVEQDALKLDWKTLELENAALVSNLPYQISARLVVERCVHPCGVESMILMFQKEVAQRITAQLKQKEHYSLLSVIAQSYWQVRNLEDVGPNDFFPPPKVASRVLVFRRKPAPIEGKGREFLTFVRHCFSQRRKMLKKNLFSYRDKHKVEAALSEVGVALTARPEELSVDQYWQLFRSFLK